MSLETTRTKDASPTVLRLPPELKEELMKHAALNDRSLSKEITIRLRISLPARSATGQEALARHAESNGILSKELPPSYQLGSAPPLTANDHGAPSVITDLDKAMLQVFRAMPVEKQLALLSLFK